MAELRFEMPNNSGNTAEYLSPLLGMLQPFTNQLDYESSSIAEHLDLNDPSSERFEKLLFNYIRTVRDVACSIERSSQDGDEDASDAARAVIHHLMEQFSSRAEVISKLFGRLQKSFCESTAELLSEQIELTSQLMLLLVQYANGRWQYMVKR